MSRPASTRYVPRQSTGRARPSARRHTGSREPLSRLLLVFLGSGLGGVLRLLLAAGLQARAGPSFPWGTLAVNVVGCLALGAFLGVRERTLLLGSGSWLFLGTGLCGGFTTMSTFSLETLALLRDREWLYAAANVSLSLAACLAATAVGLLAVRFATALPR